MTLAELLASFNVNIREKIEKNSINPDVVADELDKIANFVNENYILTKKYDTFSVMPEEGGDELLMVTEDDGVGGDGTESFFIRYNNKLFNIPAVEI